MTPFGFFILGNPRSGTSLLRNALNAHPLIAVPPECGFLHWLRPRFEQVDWDAATRARFIQEVMASRKFETWELTEQQLSEVVLSAPISTYAQAGALVYTAYARAKGKETDAWGDKNNYYVRHVPELLSLIPHARVIHIVRDPRDVVCSYLDLGERTMASKYVPVLSRNAVEAATEWQENNRLIVEGSRDLGANYMRVRYEDLVGSFQAVMGALFVSLGVSMPKDFDDRSHLRTLDEPAEFLQWKAKVAGPVDPGSVGRFRTELDAATIAAVERAASSGMHAFGYSITSLS